MMSSHKIFVTAILFCAFFAPVSFLSAEESYSINRSGSSITFVADSFLGDVEGSFQNWQSDVRISRDFKQASGSISIQVTSINTGNESRDDHLRDPDFFKTSEFPTAVYKVESIQKSNNSISVQGTLTIRGITKPHTLKLSETKTIHSIKLTGITTINRKAFGIDYDSMLNPIDELVRVNLTVLLQD